MRRVSALILVLALLGSVSLAGAENAHFGAFLTDLINAVRSVDLDTQKLTLTTASSPDVFGEAEHVDGLWNVNLQLSDARLVFQHDGRNFWMLIDDNGFYITGEDYDEISALFGNRTPLDLPSFGRMYMKMLEIEINALLKTCVTFEVKDGDLIAACTLDEERLIRYLDAYLDGVAGEPDVLQYVASILAQASASPLIRDLLTLPTDRPFTEEDVQNALVGNRDRIVDNFRQLLESGKSQSNYTEFSAELTLVQDLLRGFESFTAVITDTVHAAGAEDRVQTSTLLLGWEDSDLVLSVDGSPIARLTAATDDEVRLILIGSDGEQPAGSLRLTSDGQYRALDILDPEGRSILTLRTGPQSDTIVPLSEREDSLTKVDVAYLRQQFEEMGLSLDDLIQAAAEASAEAPAETGPASAD